MFLVKTWRATAFGLFGYMNFTKSGFLSVIFLPLVRSSHLLPDFLQRISLSMFWCDRVLLFGKGMRLTSYWRNEIKFSDHRPVTASYMVEVEVFSPKRLQRAFTFTDAEIEEEPVISDMGIDSRMRRLNLGEDISYWGR